MDEELTVEENMIKINEEKPWFFIFIICYSAVFPVMLSTLNPAIFIAFTPGSKHVRGFKNRLFKSSVGSTLNDDRPHVLKKVKFNPTVSMLARASLLLMI